MSSMVFNLKNICIRLNWYYYYYNFGWFSKPIKFLRAYPKLTRFFALANWVGNYIGKNFISTPMFRRLTQYLSDSEGLFSSQYASINYSSKCSNKWFASKWSSTFRNYVSKSFTSTPISKRSTQYLLTLKIFFLLNTS